MKQLLRPRTVIVGTALLALLGWTTASAATGSLGDRPAGTHPESAQSAQAAETPDASPTAEPEAEHQVPEPSPEPSENPEAQPGENEPSEPAENQTEDNDNESNEDHPAPAPSAAPTVSSRTFQLIGGTATFTCTGNVISLDAAVPAAGFSVETESEDGGRQVRVRFESDSHRSEIQAACSGGQVVASEMREESN